MSLSDVLKRFARARGGNFAIIVALAALPLVMALGCAIDASRFYNVTRIAQYAADAATLAAAKRMETGTAEDAEKDAQTYGQARLLGEPVQITLVNVIDEAKGTVTTTARGTYAPGFLKLAQIDSLPFERVSVAAIRQKGYMEFQFLLDVSESMNIAASAQDRAKLMKTTKKANNRPCAFACHTVEPGWSPLSIWQMNENAVHFKDDDGTIINNKATLRIDTLRSAASSMIDQILAKNNEFFDVEIQTNGFGQNFDDGVGPNKDAAALKLSMTSFAYKNDHTSLERGLKGLAGELGTQGTGALGSSRKKVALIITDGVKDENFSGSGLGPIDTNLCTSIKNKGFDLAVFEIKYVEDYDYQGYYKSRVAPFYSRISPSLQACASPGFYALATDSADTQAALLRLVDKLVTNKLRVAH